MRISDWSSDVCSSDLVGKVQVAVDVSSVIRASPGSFQVTWIERRYQDGALVDTTHWSAILTVVIQQPGTADGLRKNPLGIRSEEHTSELQSLMRISYAVFCLKKKKTTQKCRKNEQNMKID